MLVSLFGPDGVGKTTFWESYQEPNLAKLAGTDIASWPDPSWHQSFLVAAIDERAIHDPAHFIEKIERAHEQARFLEDKANTVLMDSDPFHKTLLHMLIERPNMSTSTQSGYVQDFARRIGRTAMDSWLHVHLKLRPPLYGSSEQQQTKRKTLDAIELQQRITQRRADSIFDPRTIEDSLAMLHASDRLAATLKRTGYHVLTLFDMPNG